MRSISKHHRTYVLASAHEALGLGSATRRPLPDRVALAEARRPARARRQAEPERVMAAGTTMTVHQAYRFALDPTPRQQRALASHAGAARFAFNWGLRLVKQRLEQRKTDPSVEVPWR